MQPQTSSFRPLGPAATPRAPQGGASPRPLPDIGSDPKVCALLTSVVEAELLRITGLARPATVASVRMLLEQALIRCLATADAGTNLLNAAALTALCREAMRIWLVSAHYPLQHTADLLDAVLVAAGHEPSLPARCPDLLTPLQKSLLGLLFIEGLPLERAASFLGLPSEPLRQTLAEAMERVQGLGLRRGAKRPFASA